MAVKVKEIAAAFGVTPKTIWHWKETGRLKSYELQDILAMYSETVREKNIEECLAALQQLRKNRMELNP